MPRPNRFQPGFAERLRQSRVARGLEPAPTPEPSTAAVNWPNLRELLDMPAATGLRADLIILDELLAEQRRAMGERIHQRIQDRIAHLTIPGGLVWDEPAPELPRFAPRNGIPIPPPEAVAIAPIPVLQDNPSPEPAAQEPARSPAVQPNAQLADALTYRTLHERRVQTFLNLLPEALSLFKHPKARLISHHVTQSEAGDTHVQARIPGHYPILPYVERNKAKFDELTRRVEGDGVCLSCSPFDWNTGDATIHLQFTGHAYDPRILPHLQYLTDAGAHLTPSALPEVITLRSGYCWGHEVIPGLPAGVIVLGDHTPDTSRKFSLDTPLWHLRERLRELNGDYLPLPAEALAALDPEKAAGTFPHLATKQCNAGMIAYTASPSAGQMDRQQIIKPGRFFKQYGRDDLSDEDVKQLAALIRGAMPFEVKLTHERSEIRRVYAIGPESCMCKGSERNNKAKFQHTYVDGEWVHPVEIFAHPENDLRLLYVETSDGRIGARAWVNIASKTHERIYDRDDVRGARAFLEEWLQSEGYQYEHDYLEGQKLLRLDSDAGGIICPYIDPGNYGVSIHADHLVAGGSYEANHETGHLSDHDAINYDWECACCGQGHYDDDNSYETLSGDDIGECCVDEYTEVYHLAYGHSVWVHGRDLDINNLYRTEYLSDSSSVNWCSYVYPGYARSLPSDLVVLHDGKYGDRQVAERSDCVLTVADEWMLEEDMDSDWVYVAAEGQWAEKTDCLVLVDAAGRATLEYAGTAPDGYELHPDLDASTFSPDWGGIDCAAHPDYLATLEEGEAA